MLFIGWLAFWDGLQSRNYSCVLIRASYSTGVADICE